MPEKSSSSKHPQKSKKGKNCPCCTNPKCKKIGHTIENVGLKVVVLRVSVPRRLCVHSLDQDKPGKILRRRMARPTSSLLKSMLLLPNPITFTQQNGYLIMYLLLTSVYIYHCSAPIHSLIIHV